MFHIIIFKTKFELTLDYDGKWKQITAKGSEEVDFTDFEDFNPKSGKFKDTLVYVTGRPEWAKRLFIEKRDVSSHSSFIFEPICQSQKLFTGWYSFPKTEKKIRGKLFVFLFT